jgi:hypothetical protein
LSLKGFPVAGADSCRDEGIWRATQGGKLELGDVKDTSRTFFSDFCPAPVGCVFHDLDFYSLTNDALGLFEGDLSPRVFMYFDDIKGNNTWLVSEFAGESLAVDEFNRKHDSKRIAGNRYMLIKSGPGVVDEPNIYLP